MTSVPRRKSTQNICRWKFENGQICGEQFTQKSSLTYHMRIHQDSRPFSCTICDMKFKREGDLTRHRIKHQGIKPFSCTVCSKQFTRKDNLRVHMRKHEDSRLGDQRLTVRRRVGRMSRSREVPNVMRPSLPDAAESPEESGVKKLFHDNHTSDLKLSTPENLQDCIQPEAVNLSQSNLWKLSKLK